MDSRTGDCGLTKNCTVGFVLEHDRSRYAEDVETFEATMEAEGWTKTAGGGGDSNFRIELQRKDIIVRMNLLSPSWRKRCVESRGSDVADCQSTLTVHQE